MDYKFERFRSDKIPREKILEELEKVAEKFSYTEFSFDDFNKTASISAGTVKNEFGSWEKAIDILKEHLKIRNLDLKPRKSRSHLVTYTDKDLFEEMDRIWKVLGHRPSCVEWKTSTSKISLGVYRYRFNGWNNACLKFIEYKMGTTIVVESSEPEETRIEETHHNKESTYVYKTKNIRIVPLSLRIRVLQRDNFRCVFCGRSPATDTGIKLHIDHITPLAKGGKSTEDNLQTLCQECNLGKSDNILASK